MRDRRVRPDARFCEVLRAERPAAAAEGEGEVEQIVGLELRILFGAKQGQSQMSRAGCRPNMPSA